MKKKRFVKHVIINKKTTFEKLTNNKQFTYKYIFLNSSYYISNLNAKSILGFWGFGGFGVLGFGGFGVFGSERLRVN